MRILYVAFCNNPAVETILGGMHDETLSGLPAFYYPFKMLLARGCTIDLLLYSSEPKTVVESTHFRRENLIQIRPRHRGGSARSSCRCIWRTRRANACARGTMTSCTA